MLNRENFKNGCLSPVQWATGPKCKKNLYLGPGAQGALNSELVKSIYNSRKIKKNTNSTVMDSMKQDLQLLLHKVFHLINVSCSILNTSLMHFYLNLKIHLLDACHIWSECCIW